MFSRTSLRTLCRLALVPRIPLQRRVRFLQCTKPYWKNEDDKYKDDPDVRGILGDIQEDFLQYKNKSQPINIDSEKESYPNDKTDKIVSNEGEKDIAQLLAEIYGSDNTEKESEISSIGGYQEYRDSDSRVIYDVDEERDMVRRAMEEGTQIQEDKRRKPPPGAKYHTSHEGRGTRGVYEVHELVDVLRKEKVRDLVVIRIPEERQYCDYMVIGTGRNARHISVISTLILSLYKHKMSQTDRPPFREGAQDLSSGWIAMDLGNIALHLFNQEQREHYDLESLWTVGPYFDDNTRKLEESESSLDTLERLMEVSEAVVVNGGVDIEDTEATESIRGSDSIHAK